MIASAVEMMRLSGLTELPLVVGARVVGVLTLSQLTHLVDYSGDTEWVKHRTISEVVQSQGSRAWDIPQRRDYVASASSPLSEVQAVFRSRAEVEIIPVVDAAERYLGLATRADVMAARLKTLAPPRMGGMATPIGVYLTDGIHSGGAGDFGLFLTGVTLAIQGIIANVTVSAAAIGLADKFRFDPIPMIETRFGHLAGQVTVDLESLIMLPLVMLLIRVTPLAGYHAAEHQVVHCVERGEPLEVESVRQMPRVHPRCGTNIVAAITLFSFAMSIAVILLNTVVGAVAPAVIFTIALWKPVGAFMQQYLTTRPATNKQILSGIKAADELMERYRSDPTAKVTVKTRLLRMGLLQTLCGVIATSVVCVAIAYFIPALKPYLPTLF